MKTAFRIKLNNNTFEKKLAYQKIKGRFCGFFFSQNKLFFVTYKFSNLITLTFHIYYILVCHLMNINYLVSNVKTHKFNYC